MGSSHAISGQAISLDDNLGRELRCWVVPMITTKQELTTHRTCAQETEPSIGIFDSGLGGLTVVREVLAQMPNVAIRYIADQAHVPYGERPLPEVESFALQLTHHLIRAENAALVVMACNISSSVALASAEAQVGAHAVLGVIEPGVGHALSVTQNQRVGVLATTGTVKSGAYTKTFNRLSPETFVVEVACPEFVPLIEASLIESEEARAAAARRLAVLVEAGVDTVVLGCTHYPLMLKTLEGVLGPKAGVMRFVDPARATAARAAAKLVHLVASPTDAAAAAAAARPITPVTPPTPSTAFIHSMPPTQRVPPAQAPWPHMADAGGTRSAPEHTWMTTGEPGAFRAQLERFAPELLAHGVVRALRWDEIEPRRATATAPRA
ncbi:MAG: glutamate racemase [Deltaproteobacteria bacterium]|nr:glutamate racemase [Deltaproteobacteria bacterium]